jgi:phosphatidylserine decarboxylase
VVTIKIRFAKDALPIVILLVILIIITIWFIPIISCFLSVLLVFVLFFFRDPQRRIVYNPQHILSPADGKVMAVTEYEDHEFFKARVKKVTIFLSIFNVHINRSPIAGKVVYLNYTAGKFLPAYREEAGLLNERNVIGIENNRLKVLVHQIAGILARRIVCRSKVGEQLEQGQPFGLIKFGSCTEIIFPDTIQVSVKQYDKVKAGITVIGVVN